MDDSLSLRIKGKANPNTAYMSTPFFGILRLVIRGFRAVEHPLILSLVFGAVVVCPVAVSQDKFWDAEFGVPGARGGIGPGIGAIAIRGEEIFAGGAFTQIGGVNATNVAKWDGHQWTSLGQGIGGGAFSVVRAIAAGRGGVFVGGSFEIVGGIAATNVARWDGTNWWALGTGISGFVRSLALRGHDLVVGGDIFQAGEVPVTNIARWDGTNWSAMGEGLSRPCRSDLPPYEAYERGRVDALVCDNQFVYAAGRIRGSGSLGVNNIARWDGTNWSALGQGLRVLDEWTSCVNGIVRTLAITGGILYAGGVFQKAGRVWATNMARWDGENWTSLGGGIDRNGDVYGIACVGEAVCVGGAFQSAGQTLANSIAMWADQTWSALGSGVRNPDNLFGIGSVWGLASTGSELVIGGKFVATGTSAATNIGLYHIPHPLKAERVAGRLLMSWAGTGTNLTLETTPWLGAFGKWEAVKLPPAWVGSQLVVTQDLSGPTRFYRLNRRW